MIESTPDETFPPPLPLDPTLEPTPPTEVVECPHELGDSIDTGFLCATPAPVYTQPAFPDEDGDGCPPGLVPNPEFVKGVSEPCVVVPDELAATGVDAWSALLVAVLLVAVGGWALWAGRGVGRG